MESKRPGLNVKPCVFVILAVYLVLWPGMLFADTGRLSITYQNQGLKTADAYDDYFSSLNTIYFDFWQDFEKWGSLNFSVNYYFNQDLGSVSSYRLGAHDIPLGKFRLDTDFGYVSYPISGLSGFGSFHPSTYRGLKGGKISLRSAAADLFIFAGQIYGSLGLGDENSRVYGLRTVFHPGETWTLGAGWLRLMDLPSPAPREAPRDYDVFSLDGSIKLLNHLYFLGDFHYAIEPGRDNSDGISIKTGTYFSKGNLSVELIYNYLSPEFPYLGNLFIQDHGGITMVGNYRPLRWLSLFGGLDTFNRDLQTILEDSSGNYTTYRVGTVLSPAALPRLSISFNRSKKEVTASANDWTSDFDTVFLSLSRQYRRFYWSVYYNRGNSSNTLNASSNYTLDRFYINLRRTYPAGHFIYLSGHLDKRAGRAAAFEDHSSNIQLGWNIVLNSRLILNTQLSCSGSSNDTAGARQAKSRHLGLGASIIYRFTPLALNCILRYRYTRFEDKLEDQPVKYTHQVFFSISKDLAWGRGAERLGLTGIIGRKGKIKGAVFVDLNQDGRKDPGEEGLEGIPILLDRKKIAATDSKGNFTLSGIAVGEHEVSLDSRTVPAFYEVDREKSRLTVKTGEAREVYLTVIPVGLVSGRLVLDVDENGQAGDREPTLGDLRVDLYRDGQLYRAELTDSRGVFIFDNLRPGSYIIRVNEENIEKKYSPAAKSSLELTVKPWEEKKNLVLLVEKYKKTRVKKVLE